MINDILENYTPKTIWFTGLSGAGKTTLAYAFQKELINRGYLIYVLDGDNLRGGLNSDLGFSDKDRLENIRRASEVARLFNDAGIFVICSFITPLQKYRDLAKKIIGKDRYLSVYVSTSLAVCEQRDPKGLYKKARAGELRDFTGLGAPFDVPNRSDLVIDTSVVSVADAIRLMCQLIRDTRI